MHKAILVLLLGLVVLSHRAIGQSAERPSTEVEVIAILSGFLRDRFALTGARPAVALCGTRFQVDSQPLKALIDSGFVAGITTSCRERDGAIAQSRVLMLTALEYSRDTAYVGGVLVFGPCKQYAEAAILYGPSRSSISTLGWRAGPGVECVTITDGAKPRR